MRVAEYPLAQLHWVVREDPWVRTVLLAGGGQLNALAERILDVSTFEDAETMMARSLALWERMLDITPEDGASMEARRAAVQARWLAGAPPSLAAVQGICDALCPGQMEAGYADGTIVLWRTDAPQTEHGPAARQIGVVKPAHLMLTVGDRRYLGVSGVSVEYHTGDITVSVPEED